MFIKSITYYQINSNLLLKTLIEKIDDGSILNKILDEEIYSYSRHEQNELIIKKLLNYSINCKSSNTITEQLLTEFNLGIDLYDSLYLNKEISELKNYGQIIGSHSFDHQVLSTLSKDDQSSQIEHSLNALRHYMPG